MVEGENNLHKFSPDLSTCARAHAPYMQIECINVVLKGLGLILFTKHLPVIVVF